MSEEVTLDVRDGRVVRLLGGSEAAVPLGDITVNGEQSDNHWKRIDTIDIRDEGAYTVSFDDPLEDGDMLKIEFARLDLSAIDGAIEMTMNTVPDGIYAYKLHDNEPVSGADEWVVYDGWSNAGQGGEMLITATTDRVAITMDGQTARYDRADGFEWGKMDGTFNGSPTQMTFTPTTGDDLRITAAVYRKTVVENSVNS